MNWLVWLIVGAACVAAFVVPMMCACIMAGRYDDAAERREE